MKKFLLAVLAVLMFSTVGTANILAEDSPKTKFDSYISFGDSYTRGMGATSISFDDENPDDATNSKVRIVDGAYTTIIAEDYHIIPEKGADTLEKEEQYGGQKMFGSAKEQTKYYPTATYGLKLTGALKLIQGAYYNPDEPEWAEGGILRGYIPYLFNLFGYDKDGKPGSEGHVRDLLKDGGNALVTVNLGLADVIFNGSSDAVDWSKLGSMLSDPNVLVDFLVEYAKQTKDKFEVWAKEYEEFIKEIKKLNKNSTIVLIGFFNPLREVCISDDIMLPIGSISAPIVALMNETLRFYALKYNCIYVDISKGESMAVQNEWNIASSEGENIINNFFSAIHPSPETMKYIASEVEDAIDNKYSWFKPNNHISVNLIRYGKDDVNLVVLDGEIVDAKKYKLDGTLLEMDAKDKKAKTLQVFVKEKNADGKEVVGVRTYVLMYRNGKYESYCLDSTNDIEARTNKILKPILNYMKTNEKLEPIAEAIEKYMQYKEVIDAFAEKIEKLEEMGVDIKKILTFLDKIKDKIDFDKLPKLRGSYN